jgi:hypothetical protein
LETLSPSFTPSCCCCCWLIRSVSFVCSWARTALLPCFLILPSSSVLLASSFFFRAS